PSCSARRPWPSPAGGSTESHHDKATTRRGGPVDVSMPQLGETVTEGTITRWLKQIGDRVEADEPLFEVSTDKVDSEVPSPTAGVLAEIRIAEGETVGVGTVLAVVSDDAPAAGADQGGAPAPAS